MKKGDRVSHPVYGKGFLCADPTTVESIQWTGTAVWVAFDRPQTAIAAGWPYMIPLSDLVLLWAKETV